MYTKAKPPTTEVNRLRVLDTRLIDEYREAHPAPGALEPCCGSEHGECVICNTPIRKKAHWVHLIAGGAYLLSKNSEEAYKPNAGDMGCFPIGPECAKLLPADFISE